VYRQEVSDYVKTKSAEGKPPCLRMQLLDTDLSGVLCYGVIWLYK